MSAFVQGLGSLASSEGEAFRQQREFDVQNALADARARLEASQSREADAQSGYLAAHASYLGAMSEQGRWQPLGAAYDPSTNSYSWVIRDVRHGAVQRIPMGGVPPTSLQGLLGQMSYVPASMMDDDTRQRLFTETIFKGATGSGSGAFAGQHAVWQQVPGGFQYGIYDAATKKFSPATGVQKGLPQGISTYVDAQGNTHNIQFPSIGPAPSQNGSVAPNTTAPAPLSAIPARSAPHSTFSGSVREYAHAPADVVKQLTSIQNEKGLLQDIVGVLEQRDPQSGQPLWNTDQGASKLRSMWANLLYAHGIQGDETYDQLIQKGVLSGFGGVMGLIPGLRRGDLISQAMSHLPERGDTLRMMYFKAKSLLPVYDRNMTNLLTGAQMNASGKLMNQLPAQSIQELNSSSQARTATTADVQQYATKFGMSYGEALKAFRDEGISVQPAGGKQ